MLDGHAPMLKMFESTFETDMKSDDIQKPVNLFANVET
jgi:hypothetical protein